MLPSGIELEGPRRSHGHVWPLGRDGWRAGLSGDPDQHLCVAQASGPKEAGSSYVAISPPASGLTEPHIFHTLVSVVIVTICQDSKG